MTKKDANSMHGINHYGINLTKEDIVNKVHRNKVGGMWDELGKIQYDYLKKRGLQKKHKFLDVGCGCLRGGIHFIKYLETGNYFGFDINDSLIEAGKFEIEEAGLLEKSPKLQINNEFDFNLFQTQFDFALALSVFTHLPMNYIILCFMKIRVVLSREGKFFATFFESPESGYSKPLHQSPGGIVTQFHKDPYHYSFEEISWMAEISQMTAEKCTDWYHPRNQKIVLFRNAANEKYK